MYIKVENEQSFSSLHNSILIYIDVGDEIGFSIHGRMWMSLLLYIVFCRSPLDILFKERVISYVNIQVNFLDLKLCYCSTTFSCLLKHTLLFNRTILFLYHWLLKRHKYTRLVRSVLAVRKTVFSHFRVGLFFVTG